MDSLCFEPPSRGEASLSATCGASEAALTGAGLRGKRLLGMPRPYSTPADAVQNPNADALLS